MDTIGNSRGFSLIQVLVATGVMGIVALLATSMFTNQQRELTAVTEKLALIDLQRQMTLSYASPVNCTYQVTTPTPVVFDATLVGSGSPPTVDLTKLSFGANSLASTLAEVGQRLTPTHSSLVVQAIRLENFVSEGPDLYSADLTVSFDTARMIRPLKPASMRLQMSTTGGPAAKQVNTCAAIGGPMGEGTTIVNSCGEMGPGAPICVPAACPVGWTDFGIGRYVTSINGPGSAPANRTDRTCFTDRSDAIVTLRCGGSVMTPCIPAACPTGWTDIGGGFYISAVPSLVAQPAATVHERHCQR